MEENINIADILKDKPQGTKLYADAFGEVTIVDICTEDELGVTLLEKDGDELLFYNDGKYNRHGEPILFPSKEMDDWSKFAWKKGDVLVSEGMGRLHVIFEGFDDDTYTTFKGKHYLCNYDDNEDYNEEEYNDYHKEIILRTIEFKKDNVNDAKAYINTIEERFGGKLNLETLEIDKHQEFKDGDIVAVDLDRKNIRIFKEKKNGNNIYWGKYYIGFSFNNEGKLIQTFKNYTADCSSDRLATDSEKQQLFSALENEGKAWDSNKKSIVDLKPKVEFKPMDLCLMKYIGQYNNRGWELCQYAYTEHRVSSSGEQRDFYHAVGGEIYAECIPYNEDTKHLLGTRDKWKGGEG